MYPQPMPRILALSIATLLSAAACTAPTTPTEPTPSGQAVALASSPAFTTVLTTANGSGCATGSPTPVTLTPTASGFTLTYPATLTAKAGTGVPAIEGRRNCQASITVQTAPAQTYRVTEASYMGSVVSPAGGNVKLVTRTYQQNVSGHDRVTTHETDPNAPNSGAWAPADNAVGDPALCGKSPILNVNVEVRASTPGPTASVTAQSADFDLALEAC